HRRGFNRPLPPPRPAGRRGVTIPFKPRYSGLGMRRTAELSGVEPQTLASVADDLLAESGEWCGGEAGDCLPRDYLPALRFRQRRARGQAGADPFVRELRGG